MTSMPSFPTVSAAWAASPWIARLEDARPFATAAAPWLAFIVAVIAVAALLTSRRNRERRAARQTRKLAAALLDPATYRQFHDVTFQTREGAVHIDHVLVSPFGVFVIQSMDERGEIAGKAFDPDWTRTFRDETIKFPNPLRPNFNRKLALGNLAGIGEDKLFSVIAFTDEAKFAHPMPDNVTRGKGLADYVASRNTPILAESDIAAVAARIAGTVFSRPAAPGPQAKQAGPKGRTGPSHLRFMNLLKFAAMASVLAGGAHVLHNTAQFPDMPFNPVTWLTGEAPSKAEVTRKQTIRTDAAPRSDANGILRITAARNTSLTLVDEQDGKTVLSLELGPGESREVELRKGHYTARIVQDGAVRTRRVSFIGARGALEL
ncbi:nuclease-related domain-containing protein [Desulfomicrobium salsuginis]